MTVSPTAAAAAARLAGGWGWRACRAGTVAVRSVRSVLPVLPVRAIRKVLVSGKNARHNAHDGGNTPSPLPCRRGQLAVNTAVSLWSSLLVRRGFF